MPKLKYSEELKLKVIHYVLEGHSMYQAAKEFYAGKGTVQKWMNAYRIHGVNGICIKQNSYNKYTGDFKVHVMNTSETTSYQLGKLQLILIFPHGNPFLTGRKFISREDRIL